LRSESLRESSGPSANLAGKGLGWDEGLATAGF
jgi:hypothetical protein